MCRRTSMLGAVSATFARRRHLIETPPSEDRAWRRLAAAESPWHGRLARQWPCRRRFSSRCWRSAVAGTGPEGIRDASAAWAAGVSIRSGHGSALSVVRDDDGVRLGGSGPYRTFLEGESGGRVARAGVPAPDSLVADRRSARASHRLHVPGAAADRVVGGHLGGRTGFLDDSLAVSGSLTFGSRSRTGVSRRLPRSSETLQRQSFRRAS